MKFGDYVKLADGNIGRVMYVGIDTHFVAQVTGDPGKLFRMNVDNLQKPDDADPLLLIYLLGR